MFNRKTKDKVIKTNNINMEIDDDIDNIAKENECPICFHHINKNDRQCPKCGTKLK